MCECYNSEDVPFNGEARSLNNVILAICHGPLHLVNETAEIYPVHLLARFCA